MAMQVWPAHTSHITVLVWAVVAQQKHGIFENVWLLVANAEVLVHLEEVGIAVVFEPLLAFVREDHRRCLCSAMRAGFRLV